MDILLQLLAFAITVLVLVSIHEAGHFFVAQILNVKVLRFSIGFGKPIWKRTAKSGVEYVVGILPLGGYVKLLDEREEKVPEAEKHLAFNRQSLWKRFLIVAAGPLTNIIFAMVAFWFMFVIGFESVRPMIGKITPDSVVAEAGVTPNAEIIAFNGHPVENWQEIIIALVKRMGQTGSILLKTQNEHGDVNSYSVNIDNWKVDGLNPEPLRSFGILPFSPPVEAVIDKVEDNTPASHAGLLAGDKVLSVDNRPIEGFQALSRFLQQNPHKEVVFEIERNGQKINTPITIGSKFILSGFRHIGYLGVRAKPSEYPEELKKEVNYTFLSAIMPAWDQTWEIFGFNFVVIKKMIKREISLKSLGGPITIMQTADRAFKEGVIVFLSFLALISVMLAFINVLPIPGLDGGHLLFFLIEAILRRPLSLAFEVLTLRIGMVALLLLMLSVTINDILRIIL